ncbi:MAG TPA: MFS transporter [Kofleriaceae bacterium]|nr:MFS transporter [Kofleriaceae bacterium]
MARLITRPTLIVWATLFLGALAPNLFVLAPRYLAGRGYGEDQIGLVMGAANIAMLSTMHLIGRLTARLGHRAIIAAGCLIVAAGCALFELAGHVELEVGAHAAARAVQGLGWGWILVGTGSFVAETAPADRLAQALGVAGVLTLASQAVGPSVGELLERAAGWPWVFRAGAAGGVAAALVALLLPRVDEQPHAPADQRLGAWPVLVATGLAGFGFGAVWSFLSDWSDQAGVGGVSPFFVSYVAAAISTRLFLGHLPDRFGRRATSAPALIGSAAALLWLAQLHARWHLVGIGLLFGLSHGVHYPSLQAMVVERSGARSRAIAASSFSFGVGTVTAAFGLGALAHAAGYPAIYLVAAGAAVAASTVVWTRT